MAGTASPRRPIEVMWGIFCLANLTAMALSPSWETIPFHFIWTSLSILYGFRVWSPASTLAVLFAIGLSTGTLILLDAANGYQEWGELFEVPLMSAMFLAMVWHARRRQTAMDTIACQARERAALLQRQENFLYDVSHELRTPLTIARGHIETLAHGNGGTPPEAAVALDELDRLGRLIEQLLMLAKAGHAEPATTIVDVDDLLEEVALRWAEVAPRVWRVGELPGAHINADPDALRIALDALIENAVQHTTPDDEIEVRGRLDGDTLVIEVADLGFGIAPDALESIFERFAQAEPGGRSTGHGVGLGLAIVDAIMKSHGGSCHVESGPSGSTFALSFPGAERVAGARPDFEKRPAAASLPLARAPRDEASTA